MKEGRFAASVASTLLVVLLASASGLSAQSYDLVLSGGRVMDPASGLDTVRHLGIRDGRIAAISGERLEGERVIDARGLVVAPGFVDLHSHGQDDENYRYYARDGVTTALELEIGVSDVAGFYAEREGGQRVHYGVSVGHPPVRMVVMDDPGDWLPSGPATDEEATSEQVAEIRRRIEEGLRQGALGVGFGIAYTPAAAWWELLEAFEAAGKAGAPAFVHLRSLDPGLAEAMSAAAITGTPLHIVHVNSTAGDEIHRVLDLLTDARASGLDVTTEAYPYTAGSTMIESALFDDWRSWPDERFQRYEWAPTGERLTRESFARYREQGGNVIIHSNTEENVRVAVEHPLVMVAADALMRNGKGHPRTTGTHARILGRYVRERNALTLMEALEKMTIMPARRLETRVPAMRRKGRIQIGADADLTVFDPGTVVDRSTYQEPTRAPEGMEYVLVAGVPVVEDGELVEGATPGRGVRAPH